MEIKEIPKFLVNKIHTVVMATTDEDGSPITSAIDLMDYDDDCVYFLTAKGKNFYKRLKSRPQISLTGVIGKDTTSRISVSLRGRAEEIGKERLLRLLTLNPYMFDIYKTEKSREALTVFCIRDGEGEVFDLSASPIERRSFSLGKENVKNSGYYITEECRGCGKCLSFCPQNCIITEKNRAKIIEKHCLRCGNCKKICDFNAVKVF